MIVFEAEPKPWCDVLDVIDELNLSLLAAPEPRGDLGERWFLFPLGDHRCWLFGEFSLIMWKLSNEIDAGIGFLPLFSSMNEFSGVLSLFN